MIYADILLTINLAVDYLLLFAAARLSGTEFRRLRGIASAAFGALYSLLIIFPMPEKFFFFSEFAVSGIMVLIAFGKRKAGEFLRLSAVFYICGFIFSGAMMLMNNLIHAKSFAVKGSTVYFEFSAVGIVLSASAAFIITEIFRRIFRRGRTDSPTVFRITFRGKTSVLKGFEDSGNLLTDPFSGSPVAVTNFDFAMGIIAEKEISAMKKGEPAGEYKIRYIPCRTVSGTVLMPVFRPEKVIMEREGRTFSTEDIMIGLSGFAPEKTLVFGGNVVFRELNKILSEV